MKKKKEKKNTHLNYIKYYFLCIPNELRDLFKY